MSCECVHQRLCKARPGTSRFVIGTVQSDDQLTSYFWIHLQVQWGNDFPDLAGGIGEAGAKFALEDLDMHNVYSYMLHLLKAYASLQVRPAKANPVSFSSTDLCLERVSF